MGCLYLGNNFILAVDFNPLQYSCLENPHGQRILVDCSPCGYKESDMTELLSHTTFTFGISGGRSIRAKKFHVFCKQLPLQKKEKLRLTNRRSAALVNSLERDCHRSHVALVIIVPFASIFPSLAF